MVVELVSSFVHHSCAATLLVLGRWGGMKVVRRERFS